MVFHIIHKVVHRDDPQKTTVVNKWQSCLLVYITISAGLDKLCIFPEILEPGKFG